jgi:predicted metal-dependent HD superfamily phosphohydrolase
MSTNNGIIKDAEKHVRDLFDKHYQENLVYHNIEHTKSVVQRVQEIASHYDLPDKEMRELLLAAWFHDTGHLLTDPANHEEKSVELMKQFLAPRVSDDEFMNNVGALIKMTKFPPSPQTLQEKIICDADTYHFGVDDFKKTNKAMKKELTLRHMNTLVMDWEKNTLDLLEKHQFFTSYCQELLQEGKDKNIQKFRKKVSKMDTANVSSTILGTATPSNKDKDRDKDKEATIEKQRNALLTRGIQTMLRLTSENHLELSGMADGKASILISVNAIIISVILSVLIRRIEVDTHLTIPTILFLTSSLATIIVAILATRPKVSQGNFTREEILNKKINLLFFGNFHRSSLEEYQWAMNTMMRDPDYLYGSLIQDIYHLGVILGRKYRLVRLAYTIFMIGILISVIAFVLAMLLHTPQQTIVNEPSISPF